MINTIYLPSTALSSLLYKVRGFSFERRKWGWRRRGRASSALGGGSRKQMGWLCISVLRIESRNGVLTGSARELIDLEQTQVKLRSDGCKLKWVKLNRWRALAGEGSELAKRVNWEEKGGRGRILSCTGGGGGGGGGGGEWIGRELARHSLYRPQLLNHPSLAHLQSTTILKWRLSQSSIYPKQGQLDLTWWVGNYWSLFVSNSTFPCWNLFCFMKS